MNEVISTIHQRLHCLASFIHNIYQILYLWWKYVYVAFITMYKWHCYYIIPVCTQVPTYFSTYYYPAFILLQKIIPFFAYIVVFLKALKRFFMLTLASVVWYGK